MGTTVKILAETHHVIKLEDAEQLPDHLQCQLKEIKKAIRVIRLKNGKQSKCYYVVVNTDEPYYEEIIQLVLDREIAKKEAKELKSTYTTGTDDIVNNKDVDPEKDAAERFFKKFATPIEEDEGIQTIDFDYVPIGFDVFGVNEFDKIFVDPFITCPDCKKINVIDHPESFLFEAAELNCECGNHRRVTSGTHPEANHLLRRVVWNGGL